MCGRPPDAWRLPGCSIRSCEAAAFPSRAWRRFWVVHAACHHFWPEQSQPSHGPSSWRTGFIDRDEFTIVVHIALVLISSRVSILLVRRRLEELTERVNSGRYPKQDSVSDCKESKKCNKIANYVDRPSHIPEQMSVWIGRQCLYS
jgi:hypothetical protein